MSLSIIGHGAVASVYVGVDNIIGYGTVDNGYASIIGRLRYMYTRAFFFKLVINYALGGYRALKYLSLQKQSRAKRVQI